MLRIEGVGNFPSPQRHQMNRAVTEILDPLGVTKQAGHRKCGIAEVDRKLIAASATLGASPARTFSRVIAPLSMPGLITGIALSFAHTMGEFGVVLMLGGNIPGVTRTVSIDIYDRVQASDYVGANATALVLLVLCFMLLAVVYGFNRKGWALNLIQ